MGLRRVRGITRKPTQFLAQPVEAGRGGLAHPAQVRALGGRTTAVTAYLFARPVKQQGRRVTARGGVGFRYNPINDTAHARNPSLHNDLRGVRQISITQVIRTCPDLLPAVDEYSLIHGVARAEQLSA